MYSQLIKTEFEANRFVLFVSLILNIFFFIIIDRTDQNPVSSFIGATGVAFIVCLIVAAVTSGDEKRARLYAQLPVTATESFLAGWFWALTWLGLQVCAWILFAFALDPGFENNSPIEIASRGIGMWFLIVLVANAIDLGNFKPGYVQWGYIGGIVILLATFSRFRVNIGIGPMQDDNPWFPMGLFADTSTNILFGCTMIALLMLANWYIIVKSDNYLK